MKRSWPFCREKKWSQCARKWKQAFQYLGRLWKSERAGWSVKMAGTWMTSTAWVLSRMGKVDLAILKSGSPTCGVHDIYDGTFSGKKIKGRGVLAEALVRAGVPVVDEKELLSSPDAEGLTVFRDKS